MHSDVNRRTIDNLLLFGLAAITFILAVHYDLFETIVGIVHRHESWELDEFITLAIVLAASLLAYSYRRVKDQKREIARRLEIEQKQKETLQNLKAAMAEIKTLEGLIPMCSNCKRVRDDQGFWKQVEEYLSMKTDARFSHSLCPDCLKELYPDIAERLAGGKEKIES